MTVTVTLFPNVSDYRVLHGEAEAELHVGQNLGFQVGNLTFHLVDVVIQLSVFDVSTVRSHV